MIWLIWLLAYEKSTPINPFKMTANRLQMSQWLMTDDGRQIMDDGWRMKVEWWVMNDDKLLMTD